MVLNRAARRWTRIALQVFAPVLCAVDVHAQAVAERIAGVTTSMERARSDRGYDVRLYVSRPADAGTARLPAVLFVPWLSCDPVQKASPGADGFAHMLRGVAGESGMLLMRVEKPGVDGAAGPSCGDSSLEDDLAAFRAALAALRRRPDVDTGRVFLLGGSIGGALAPILGAEDPRGIRGIISVGGFTRTWYEHMLDIERRRLELSGNAPPNVNEAMRGFARFYTDYLLGRQTPAQVVSAHPELKALWYDEPTRQYGRRAEYFHAVQALNVEAAWQRLARLRIPALIVWGEYDWIMGRGEPERAVAVINAEAAGTATLVVLPKTDHGLMTYASPLAAFRDSVPRYDGMPHRTINEWLRGRSR